MTFISSSVGSAVEPQVQPEGVYDLRIKEAKIHTSDESKKDSVLAIIKVEGGENAADVFHYVSLVHPSDDPEKANNKLLMQKRFLELFNIPYEDDGFNLEDFPGATARAWLAVEQDNNGIDRNKIKFRKV